ncbi:hypothetical protein KQI46_15735 [Lysinibacillus capsici]|uniref:hypothetical protein n=1 Tax=Lysinibacillus capsici TaxID=2115968 RepID=UPI001C0F9960|nr:hypothetical protein [Lysinibacillus capsici]MBU5253338.1 hypothetical protein [Lysinibacillus capsici]
MNKAEKDLWEDLVRVAKSKYNTSMVRNLSERPILKSLEAKGYLVIENEMLMGLMITLKRM